MTILVTGGCGYIGSHMTWCLHDAGEDFIVIDNLSTGFDWAIPQATKLYEGEITDLDLLETIFKAHDISAVIHFAGSIIVPESVSNPLKYYSNNTAASRTLMEACVNHGIKHFIFSSTAAVYGDPEVIPVSEEAPLTPLSPYGTSKLMTELMLRDTAAAHDFKYTALRYFNVAGADPKGRTGQSTKNATHLIKVACEAALGKRTNLGVFGIDFDTPDGTGVRDYIHVSDLASAHYLALRRLREGGDSIVMNAGYGDGYSVLQVIDAVKAISGVDFNVTTEPRRAGDSPKVVADNRKIMKNLDWQPEFNDLKTIVDHALTWEKKLQFKNSL
ncbi:UDP-glucose 4-epimerase GalE [Pseudovibrio sp. Tun.PSC04-5.I4]|uniref:UDP-glucose 4-epimerase GalE n=1 Tax=Pseudovibrio sp. Tun.PSC04-5.I4 TaxID=1798213 RepID=UPI00088733FC|nr:UDP-glucose 4-epimerase GalE [Pseudovibrio sp. Tun.PSC04-5.I4]SDR04215.1 UDP-galactose 4-epimerase [Pseudovibrio sp. Tun.PSC04-5.I4]